MTYFKFEDSPARWDGGEESRITALMRRNRDLEITLAECAELAVDIHTAADDALEEIYSSARAALKRGKA